MSSPLDHHDDPQAAENPDRFASADPQPGARIGAHEVVRALARGGMATVLEVRHLPTGEHRALKLLLPLAHADEARSRFRREFRALSRLHHPNVLRVYEWGLLGDRPWFSMELVSGRDLRDEVTHLATLQPEDRFARVEHILKQVTRALAYIHERGLVHRDVTPGNIMVSPDGTVKIMDFGVVKEMGAEFTAVGEVIGTVAWMAPEQIRSDELDARADLYSLGCVLYLLLTGKRPFNAHTIHGFMEKHLREIPLPPRQVDPQVPAHLDAICTRLLQKKPADRFASATHLLHVLGDPPDALDLDVWPPRTVGRGPLRARLRDALDDLEQHGVGSAILITGENGQGKTRLLDAALTHARRLGLRVVRGRCRHQDRPFGPFFGIYEKLDKTGPNDLLDQVFSGATPDERYPVLAAFKDLLLTNAPVVVALDDLEQADAATVELLTYLIRNMLELASEPVLFLLAHEAPEAHVLRELDALGPVQTTVLEPLGASEVEELVVSVLGPGSAALALAERIYTETGGSPAFIADMLRSLLDDALIVRREDRYELVLDATEITRSRLPMPASLRQALQERIAPLSPVALEVGRAIALARRRIDLDVLVDVVDLDEDSTMEGLDELVDAQIVVELRDADVERVELSHSRFHDVLLEDLSPEARASLHRRTGEALERHHRGQLGPLVEELGHHFLAAGLAPKAYAFLQLAIERHVRQSLFGEAMALLQQALEVEPMARPYLLLDDADTRLVELLVQRSMAEEALGQMDASLQSLRDADRLADVVGDPRLQARVASELGTRLQRMGEHAEANRQLERAVQKAREAGDQTLLPPALYHQGSHAWMSGDLERALTLWREALTIATTVGDARNAAWANNGLGIGHTCAGDSLAGRRHFEQAARQMEALGMVGPLSIIRCNLAELYLSTGLIRKALSQIDRAIDQSREVGHVHGVATGLMWRANTYRILGRLDDAARTIAEAQRYCQEHQLEADGLAIALVEVELALDRGRYEEALHTLDAARPLLDRHDNEGQRNLVDAWRAIGLARLGDLERARAILEGRRPPEEPWQNTQVRTDLAWGQAFHLLGRCREARALLLRALKTAEQIGYRLYQLLIHQELLAVTEGEEAARHARIATSLARSLAANLPREDSKRFLARGWGKP